MTHFLILLRNLRPKKVHGKPGQAVPLLPATKKARARASASQHYILAELLLCMHRNVGACTKPKIDFRLPAMYFVDNILQNFYNLLERIFFIRTAPLLHRPYISLLRKPESSLKQDIGFGRMP